VGWGEGRERGEKTRKTLIRYLHPRNGPERRFDAFPLVYGAFRAGIKTEKRTQHPMANTLSETTNNQPTTKQ
jgi:hypothetical protein